jgi:hypothetical protein
MESFVLAGQYEDAICLEGRISDESPNAAYIVFGGILEGHTAVIEEDGTFSYSAYVSQYGGIVTAYATDSEGLVSEVFMVFV